MRSNIPYKLLGACFGAGVVVLVAALLAPFPNVESGVIIIPSGIKSQQVSGSDAYGVTVNGSRWHFGTGASDYASSDGTTVTFASPLTITGAFSGATTGAFSGLITSTVATGNNAYLQATGARLKLGGGTTDYFTSNGTTMINAAGDFGVAGTITATDYRPQSTGAFVANSHVADGQVAFIAAASTNLTSGKIFSFRDNVSTEQAYVDFTGSIQAGTALANEITLAGAAAASAVSITATGSDTNVDIALNAQGADGTVQLVDGARFNTTASRPTCASGLRGLTWITQGGAGVADIFSVCEKNAADAYAFVDFTYGNTTGAFSAYFVGAAAEGVNGGSIIPSQVTATAKFRTVSCTCAVAGTTGGGGGVVVELFKGAVAQATCEVVGGDADACNDAAGTVISCDLNTGITTGTWSLQVKNTTDCGGNPSGCLCNVGMTD